MMSWPTSISFGSEMNMSENITRLTKAPPGGRSWSQEGSAVVEEVVMLMMIPNLVKSFLIAWVCPFSPCMSVWLSSHSGCFQQLLRPIGDCAVVENVLVNQGLQHCWLQLDFNFWHTSRYFQIQELIRYLAIFSNHYWPKVGVFVNQHKLFRTWGVKKM